MARRSFAISPAELENALKGWVVPGEMAAKWEGDRFQGAMVGLAHLMRHIAPIHLMCSPRDISVTYHSRDPFTGRPTLILYDALPGGVGLSDRVYEMEMQPFREALDRLNDCPCQGGCPSCVGVAAGAGAKRVLAEVLRAFLKEGDG